MNLKDRLQELKEKNLITTGSDMLKREAQSSSRRRETGGKGPEPNRAAETTSPEQGLAPNIADQIDARSYCEASFPPDSKHGGLRLNRFLDLTPELLGLLRYSDDRDPRDFRGCAETTVFMDTETTGLSGGAGTYIFLLGIGYFQDHQLAIRQYFLTRPEDEAELLQHVQNFMSGFTALVTFNGKSFDLPIIKDRTVQSRLESKTDKMEHIDLLHPSRRIWSFRLESCGLGSLEKHLFHLDRDQDLPSSWMPHLYFDYLNSGQISEVLPAFYHNRLDILSLVSLSIHLGQCIERQMHPERSCDHLGLALFWSRLERWSRAEEHYRSALALGLDPPLRRRAEWELASLYKKQDRMKAAERMWSQMIQNSKFPPLDPFVELAKYQEHHQKDDRAALDTVRRALKALHLREQHLEGGRGSRKKEREELLHRMRRLEKRLARKEQYGPDSR